MHVAQSRIFALGTGLPSYLEFDLHGDRLTLFQMITSLEEPRMTTGGVNLVVLSDQLRTDYPGQCSSDSRLLTCFCSATRERDCFDSHVIH
jgi:hypothetical protein